MYLLSNSQLSYFAFVPLNDRTIPRYAKGLYNSYKTSLKDISNNTPEILNAGHPQNSRYRNISRGHDYAGMMTNAPVDSNVKGTVNRLVPLVTDVKGKQTTVGLRRLEGIHLEEKNMAGRSVYTSGIDGYTATHPKYKNQGSKALLETMSGYAANRPNETHYISGASAGLDRLYRKQASGMNLPPNLKIAGEMTIE